MMPGYFHTVAVAPLNETCSWTENGNHINYFMSWQFTSKLPETMPSLLTFTDSVKPYFKQLDPCFYTCTDDSNFGRMSQARHGFLWAFAYRSIGTLGCLGTWNAETHAKTLARRSEPGSALRNQNRLAPCQSFTVKTNSSVVRFAC